MKGRNVNKLGPLIIVLHNVKRRSIVIKFYWDLSNFTMRPYPGRYPENPGRWSFKEIGRKSKSICLASAQRVFQCSWGPWSTRPPGWIQGWIPGSYSYLKVFKADNSWFGTVVYHASTPEESNCHFERYHERSSIIRANVILKMD